MARNRVNKKEKEKLAEKLDSLLDIISCKCDIKRCAETECCPQCPSQVHINCTCPMQAKIPRLELSFVLAQRTKKGEKGEIMIAGADFAEDAKQAAKQERNKIEVQRIREKKKKEDAIEMELEERAQEEIQATLEEP